MNKKKLSDKQKSECIALCNSYYHIEESVILYEPYNEVLVNAMKYCTHRVRKITGHYIHELPYNDMERLILYFKAKQYVK